MRTHKTHYAQALPIQQGNCKSVQQLLLTFRHTLPLLLAPVAVVQHETGQLCEVAILALLKVVSFESRGHVTICVR